MDPQAEQLNQVLSQESPVAFELLSDRGKRLYFPHAGILGQSAAAKGVKYNATIGIACEDDGSPMRLKTLADHIDVPPAKAFPYAPSFGNPELRKTWREMMIAKNPGLDGKTFSVPVVTHALTHGLYVAGSLFLNPGDEVLVPNPYWDNYDLLFGESLNTRITTFPCFEDDARFNFPAFESALDERAGGKVVLLLNFPNNPTGYTPLEEEMQGIAARLKQAAEKGTRIVVVLDDAYFGLVYESGVAMESLFAQLVDLHDNIFAVKLDGATKEDYVWGFRVGFITFGGKNITEASHKALADKAAGAIRGMISNCNSLAQTLLLNAYTSGEYKQQKREKYDILKNRYQVLKGEFERRPEFAEVFTPLPYNSGYFMCIRPAKGIDAVELGQCLLKDFDTGVIALQGLVRIAFSSVPAENIPQLMDNLYKACLKVRK